MRFIINGPPLAKQRHRVHKHGGFYDPLSSHKKSIQSDIVAQMSKYLNHDDRSIVGQLKAISDAEYFTVFFEFHVKPPKSDPWGLKPCNNKSDIDNYCKMLLDCCNSILYSDDHKIVALKAIKCYNPIPKTIMDIEPMIVTEQISAQQQQVLKAFHPEELKEFLDDVWMFTNHHSADFEVMDQCEWDKWLSDVSALQVTFAKKWGPKLNKIGKAA